MAETEIAVVGTGAAPKHGTELKKKQITWKGAFWVHSGVISGVLFSMGGIAANTGTPSWMVWTISMIFGFCQCFTYAEIASIFPGKSGGCSVYGAMAWIRYSKFVAPITIWCNWFAWSPVLALGSQLCAGYILHAFFEPNSAVMSWQITILPLEFIADGLCLRINAVFVVASVLLLSVFTAQYFGIARAAKIIMYTSVAAMTPIFLCGIVPYLAGDVVVANLWPAVPLNGAWDLTGWKLFLGGLFLAGWCTYGFETIACYTSELKDPRKDTIKAVFAAGCASLFIFTTVPIAFQGVLGLEGVLAPGIGDGSAIGETLANMIHAGPLTGFIVFLLILAFIVVLQTAIAGSSRTIYQASYDGWFPKFLSRVNQHGSPHAGMWTDLAVNLFLLLLSDYLFVLAVANVCYLTYAFLCLNSGWIHRIDNAHVERAWKAPTWLIGWNTILAFVNIFLVGAGANAWGKGTLISALCWIAVCIPIFAYRHYVVEKGEFPKRMLEDLGVEYGKNIERKAGILPYLALAAGVVIMVTGAAIFWNA